MDVKERWEYIADFPDFSVSSDGRVMNDKTSHILSTRINGQGILMVNLMRDGRIYTRSVALLVARAWLKNRDPDIYNSVIHLNNDRTDCRAENLMWRPRWFTVRYHHQFVRTPYKGAVYLIDTDEVFDNIRDAAMKYGLLEENIFADLLNKKGVFPDHFIFEKYTE